MSEPTLANAQGSLAAALPGRAHPPVAVRSPWQTLLVRGLMAVALLALVTLVTYAGRDGYIDDAGGAISVLDALYYATVTTTTTGYGDITPVTPAARLATIFIVTPARLGLLLLLVGTTVELLTARWREEHRRLRWRHSVKDHYVIIGYGVKGHSAARALCESGVHPEEVVVVEQRRNAAEEASGEGHTIVLGDATRKRVLEEARVDVAKAVIVATERDDSAVLITLTARELGPSTRIVVSVREEENAHLLRQGGADEAIVSAETSGRLLGLTSRDPQVGAIVNDLLHTDYGLALVEQEVTWDQAGTLVSELPGQRTIAVIRGAQLMRYDDAEVGRLREGDRVIGFPAARAKAPDAP